MKNITEVLATHGKYSLVLVTVRVHEEEDVLYEVMVGNVSLGKVTWYYNPAIQRTVYLVRMPTYNLDCCGILKKSDALELLKERSISYFNSKFLSDSLLIDTQLCSHCMYASPPPNSVGPTTELVCSRYYGQNQIADELQATFCIKYMPENLF